MIVSREVGVDEVPEVVAGPVADRFEDWYLATWPGLVRSLTVFCGDGDLATDHAAEAFARACAVWDGPTRPRHADAWIYTVAFNLARRQGARRRRERDLLIGGGTTVAAATERDLDLWDAVARLSPRAREAIVLRYVADLRERDIAAVMAIAEGTVAATLNRARTELRATLEREGPA